MIIKIGKIKLAWFDNCDGWIMTGIIGPGAKWFFGYSRNLHSGTNNDAEQQTTRKILIVSELPTTVDCNTLYALKTEDADRVRFYYTTKDTVGLQEVIDNDMRMLYMDLLLRGASTTEDDDGKWWL